MMKRTPLNRKTGLRRKTPLRAVNRQRRAKLFERNFGEHAEKIRNLSCYGCGYRPPSDPAHAVSRKMGGCGGDRRVLWPGCKDNPATGRVGCHTLFDTDMEAFTERTGLDRADVIREAERLWKLAAPTRVRTGGQ